MLISGTRQFSCRKQSPFVLFRYQCLWGPTYSCEKCCFCLHDYILYSTPNWYALVKSCISVNHYVLLVRRHLKYVWFTKFWNEVKNGSSLGISKNKNNFQLQGALLHWPPDQGLCLKMCKQYYRIMLLPGSVYNYTVFRKKHPLTFSFISPWIICGFKQKLQ